MSYRNQDQSRRNQEGGNILGDKGQGRGWSQGPQQQGLRDWDQHQRIQEEDYNFISQEDGAALEGDGTTSEKGGTALEEPGTTKEDGTTTEDGATMIEGTTTRKSGIFLEKGRTPVEKDGTPEEKDEEGDGTTLEGNSVGSSTVTHFGGR